MVQQEKKIVFANYSQLLEGSLIIIDLMSVLRISAPSIEHQVSAMLSILVRYPSLSQNFISLLGKYNRTLSLSFLNSVVGPHHPLMRIQIRTRMPIWIQIFI